MQDPSVSIIVPTFNRQHQLTRLLHSLDSLIIPGRSEVLIMDDCSTDDTPIILEAWGDGKHDFEARYVRMKKNGGPAKARNQGIQEAEGNIIAFTDDDCVVHRDWIVNLLSSLDSDDNIVGVGGRVLALDDSLISLYNTVHRILEPPRSRKYLVSANCCYLREPVVQVEGFDMDIAKPGGEDIGLSFKLYKRGHRFAFARKAIVYHDYRNDIVDFVRTFTNYGEGCRYVTEKYFANGGRLD